MSASKTRKRPKEAMIDSGFLINLHETRIKHGVYPKKMVPVVRELVDALRSAKDEPHLGCATTAELLTELQARAEVGGYASYRTVDGYEVLDAPRELVA